MGNNTVSQPDTKTIRMAILASAGDAVLKDRAATHGKPEDTFQCFAELLDWWQKWRPEGPTQAWEGSFVLELLKLARKVGNPTHFDNHADGAGYAACTGELAMRGLDIPHVNFDTMRNALGTGLHSGERHVISNEEFAEFWPEATTVAEKNDLQWQMDVATGYAKRMGLKRPVPPVTTSREAVERAYEKSRVGISIPLTRYEQPAPSELVERPRTVIGTP